MSTASRRKDHVTLTAAERRTIEPDGPGTLRLVVKREGGTLLLPVEEIEALLADGNFVVVHVPGAEHRVRIALSQLLDRLTGAGFIRVHRSTVVRLSSIVGIEKGSYRKAFVVLRSGRRFEIGRADFQRLRVLWQPGILDLSELSRTLHLVSSAPLPRRAGSQPSMV